MIGTMSDYYHPILRWTSLSTKINVCKVIVFYCLLTQGGSAAILAYYMAPSMHPKIANDNITDSEVRSRTLTTVNAAREYTAPGSSTMQLKYIHSSVEQP